MSSLIGISDLLQDPQRQAADPSVSAWVAASAGTGKTKVLTDRVLNLLLGGAEPHRLLCLTFTKAAAAEMKKRITDQLGIWASLRTPELIASLGSLLDRPPDDDEILRARRLFSRVLEVPNGLKIQTIHAFCQALIARFPLEAAIAPHFSVADERAGRDMLEQAMRQVLAEAPHDAGVRDAVAELSGRLAEGRLADLLAETVRHAPSVRRCLADWGGADGVIGAVRRRLGVLPDATADSILKAACSEASFDGSGLKAAAAALASGQSGDVACGQCLTRWLAMGPADREWFFSDYRKLFVKSGSSSDAPQVKSRIFTQAAGRAHPFIQDILRDEAQRILDVVLRLGNAACADLTIALFRLTSRVLAQYQEIKGHCASLDFDDLIAIAARLLERQGSGQWVLYKLDGGIDHLLVDEAQDTSVEQWRVIRALTAEFYEDRPFARRDRTLFFVGDAKQSIYSFQGAAPECFIQQRKLSHDLSSTYALPLRHVALSVSYRSTKAILTAVDAVFARAEARAGVALEDERIVHTVSGLRELDGGLVEVWPVVAGRQEDDPEAWEPPIERLERDAPHARLARLLALRISQMLSGSEILPSRGRAIEPGDIMILVRRRDAFVDELVRACKLLDIPISGIDRIALGRHIAIMDLVALGRFVICPHDDLNLANLLKSPLLGVDDDLLFDIAYRRHGTLWDSLQHLASDIAAVVPVHRRLSGFISLAEQHPPFEFFSAVLGKFRGRHHFLARLGPEVDEPINEFLELALTYQCTSPPSLQGFLAWIGREDLQVKRDPETGRSIVRLITVHGAKGLQAPIVILPDTLQLPTRDASSEGSRIYWEDCGESKLVPICAPAEIGFVSGVDDLKRRADDKQLAEYRRLLYVAMTRAEDRLLVCGWRRKKQGKECWYDLIRDGLMSAGDRIGLQLDSDAFLAAAAERGDFDGPPTVLRLTCPQLRQPAVQGADRATDAEWEAPYWLQEIPPAEQSPRRPVAPSRPTLGAARPAPSRPLVPEAVRRGRLTHRLLKELADCPEAERPLLAEQWLKSCELGADLHQRREIVDEAQRVIALYPEIFGPQSFAEIGIAGCLGADVVAGQVDRLVVAPRTITIIDFKTDRPPPPPPRIPASYLKQMALYRDMMRAAFPQRTVRCLLLWTFAPTITRLPDRILDPFTILTEDNPVHTFRSPGKSASRFL